jgi:tryptophan synthase alpha chain
LRQQGVDTPFILMGYINPILAFGIKEYIDAAADIKADGLIIPDLPLEDQQWWNGIVSSEDLR